MHRFQIAVFGAVAVVFSVIGVDSNIFTNLPARDAMAAGWLILAFVNIVWTLYFTSEQDSLVLHIFNLMGTGGLTPPGRRRTRTQSLHNMGGNGYQAGYAAPGGLGPVGYDNKSHSFAGPLGSGASLKAPSMEARSITGASVNQQNAGSIRGPGSAVGAAADPAVGLASPAMSSGAAGVGAGGGIQNVPSGGPGTTSPVDPSAPGAGPADFVYRAKALYPCKSL